MLSKYASGAQVVQAEFVKSSVRTEDCPSDGIPEFALVGRSNVGKSSLLNSLVRRKKLALTSKKPGKQFSSTPNCLCFFSDDSGCPAGSPINAGTSRTPAWTGPMELSI